MSDLQQTIEAENEKPTTEHELYLSIGLKIAVKPSVFKEEVDTLLFENIGYMQSWGTHTKDEYTGIIDNQSEKLKRLRTEHDAMKNVLEHYAADPTSGNHARFVLQNLTKEEPA